MSTTSGQRLGSKQQAAKEIILFFLKKSSFPLRLKELHELCKKEGLTRLYVDNRLAELYTAGAITYSRGKLNYLIIHIRGGRC